MIYDDYLALIIPSCAISSVSIAISFPIAFKKKAMHEQNPTWPVPYPVYQVV